MAKKQNKAHRAEAAAGHGPLSRRRLAAPVRYAVMGALLFLLIGAQGGGVERQTAIGAVVILVASLFGETPHWALRRRLSLPVCAVALYFLLNCAAGLYSRFGSFAVGEFAKILAAFCVFGVVLLWAKREEAPQLAAMAASVSAAFGLLSIDASSLHLLSTPYFSLMDNVLGCRYMGLSTGYEAGARISGVFGNPNVLAGFLALGLFLSLYLVRSAATRRGRLGACVLLMVNALSFLLAFSMGAIGTFLAAVLLYLLAEARGRRVPLFLLMAETGLVTLVMAFLSFAGLGKSGAAAALPDLAALGGGVLLWALHEFGCLRLAVYLSEPGRAKTGALAAAGLAAALVLYLVLAFNVTGGYTLAPGETLRRSVYPAPGEYQLALSSDGSEQTVTLTVESQNRVQTITHTSTGLYSGPLAGASFTVPEDSMVVYLNLRSETGARLNALSLSGGPKVKLGYRLLPAFAANRLQGLWANQNAIQRLIFFQDGLRVYAQSPVIGNGLGSVEGLVTSAQDFYYESRYVHNQYIQVLAEMGIPGLLSFLFLLGAPAAALWKRRREGEGGHLLPALAACLAMMALHAVTEVDWSMGPYQALALLVLGMIAVYFGKPLPRADHRAVSLAASIGTGAVCCLFAWFVGNNLYAERAYSEFKVGLREQTPQSMTELASRDPYNWPQYKLDMAVNAAQSPREEYAALAARYAEECRALRIHSINLSLETYVYLPMGRYEELFAASREGIPQAASRATTWREVFSLYGSLKAQQDGQGLERAQWFAEQIIETYEMLAAYNVGRLELITLLPSNLQLIDQMLALRAAGHTGQQARQLMDTLLFSSGHAADTDSNGIPDRMTSLNGSLSAGASGWSLGAGDTLDIVFQRYGGGEAVAEFRCDDPGAVTGVAYNGVPLEFQTDGGAVTARLPLSADVTEHHLNLSTASGLELRDAAVRLVG